MKQNRKPPGRTIGAADAKHRLEVGAVPEESSPLPPLTGDPQAFSPQSRPSLRDLARLAGTSVMSVSRALRNQPKVSPEIRAHVLDLAQRLGYRPDPEISKLMNHLRSRRKLAFQGLICALCNRPIEPNAGYVRQMVEGARRQAENRGFGFTLLQFELGQERSLQRLLRTRDVQGIIVLPLQQPADLTRLLSWTELSAVSATSSLLEPQIHRITPHHLANTLLLCRELAARGYRRIGLVMDVLHDLRVNHAFTAAVTWHGLYAGASFVEPLIYDGQPAGIDRWFSQQQPDVIVTQTDSLARKLAKTLDLPVPGRVGFASTYTHPDSTIAGIDEMPGNIGAAAIDMLSSMIQARERGVPATARTTSLHGRWHQGLSCPGLTDLPGRVASG